MIFVLVVAWFNVTELDPSQRNQVGTLITAMANSNRLKRGYELHKKVIQPVFFTSGHATPSTSKQVTSQVSLNNTLGQSVSKQMVYHFAWLQFNPISQSTPNVVDVPTDSKDRREHRDSKRDRKSRKSRLDILHKGE